MNTIADNATIIVTIINLLILAAAAGMGIYLLRLVIKALKIYINKNS